MCQALILLCLAPHTLCITDTHTSQVQHIKVHQGHSGGTGGVGRLAQPVSELRASYTQGLCSSSVSSLPTQDPSNSHSRAWGWPPYLLPPILYEVDGNRLVVDVFQG